MIKLGGFGITTLMQISTAAFVGSWCNSICKISQRFPSRADLCDNLINYASPPPFYQHLCEAVASLPATVESDGEALTPQTLSGLLENPVNSKIVISLKRTLQHVLCKHLVSSMLQARIRSCQ